MKVPTQVFYESMNEIAEIFNAYEKKIWEEKGDKRKKKMDEGEIEKKKKEQH